MTPSPTTTVLLVTGVALVAWVTVRFARRRVRNASPTVPYYARASTARPERRLDRRPAARTRVARDLHCPAGRTLPQRHTTRRPDDR
jgi:hypothetical protein